MIPETMTDERLTLTVATLRESHPSLTPEAVRVLAVTMERVERELTDAELAEATGLSEGAINRIRASEIFLEALRLESRVMLARAVPAVTAAAKSRALDRSDKDLQLAIMKSTGVISGEAFTVQIGTDDVAEKYCGGLRRLLEELDIGDVTGNGESAETPPA